MKIVMKKESYNYFDEFIKISRYIIKSAEILQETLLKFNQQIVENNVSKLHNLEQEADKTLHVLRNYLVKDFLPPIDREDIIAIGHKLDDIEDNIDEVLSNFSIYNIKTIKIEIFDFTELLIRCCRSVEECLIELKKSRKLESLKENIIQINQLEETGDKIFEDAMKKLYSSEKDCIEIIKWSNIFNCLENAIDSCEHVADCIEDVIMKNS